MTNEKRELLLINTCEVENRKMQPSEKGDCPLVGCVQVLFHPQWKEREGLKAERREVKRKRPE